MFTLEEFQVLEGKREIRSGEESFLESRYPRYSAELRRGFPTSDKSVCRCAGIENGSEAQDASQRERFLAASGVGEIYLRRALKATESTSRSSSSCSQAYR